MLEDYEDYLTPYEVAELLAVSVTTAYTLIRQNKIPAVRFSKKLIRVPKQGLVDYFRSALGIYE